MHINRREFIIAGATSTIAVGLTGCRDGERSATPGSPPATSAAVTQLSVIFSGLIGMVSQNSGTDFLLVDGVKTVNQEHQPRLVAPANTTSTGLAANGTLKDGRPYWDLKDRRVTLMSGVNTGTSRAPSSRRPGEEEKPNPDAMSHSDTTWVVNMSRIAAAGTGQINMECLAPDPRPAKVASRARFNGGEVGARFEPPFHDIVWQIGESPNPFRQSLGKLKLTQMIKSSPIVFHLDPFDPGTGAGGDIILAPATGANLELEIANLPTVEQCKSASDGNNLAHFAAFYQLLAVPPSSTPIPTCKDGNCPGCPAGGEVVYCPPADYNP